MCSGSEAGSYLRLIDFVYHSILGLRVIEKKIEKKGNHDEFELPLCYLGGGFRSHHRVEHDPFI